MTTDINKLIEDTERLLAAAATGPFEVKPSFICEPTSYLLRNDELGAVVDCRMEPDARLFAAAPAALRALVDEVKRLRQQVAKLGFDAITQPNADWEPNSKNVAELENQP